MRESVERVLAVDLVCDEVLGRLELRDVLALSSASKALHRSTERHLRRRLRTLHVGSLLSCGLSPSCDWAAALRRRAAVEVPAALGRWAARFPRLAAVAGEQTGLEELAESGLGPLEALEAYVVPLSEAVCPGEATQELAYELLLNSLARLLRKKRLQSVGLKGLRLLGEFWPAQWAALAEELVAPALRTLDCSAFFITTPGDPDLDSFLPFLRQFNSLTTLKFDVLHCSEDTCAELIKVLKRIGGGLEELQINGLTLSGTSKTPEALSQEWADCLAHMPGLRRLSGPRLGTQSSVFPHPLLLPKALASLQHLTHLRLAGIGVSDALLTGLCGLKRLRSLSVWVIRVGASAFKALDGLTELERLWLLGAQEWQNVGSLRSLGRLSSLGLSDAAAEAAELHLPSYADALRRLADRHRRHGTSLSLHASHRTLAQITEVELGGSLFGAARNYPDRFRLDEMPSLARLTLSFGSKSWTKVAEDEMWLKGLRLPSLRVLHISVSCREALPLAPAAEELLGELCERLAPSLHRVEVSLEGDWTAELQEADAEAVPLLRRVATVLRQALVRADSAASLSVLGKGIRPDIRVL